MRKITWLDKLLCWIGIHDWRDGPGYPCVICGQPDDFWEEEND